LPDQTRKYYPALDGVRGIASLLVVSYHLFENATRYLFFGWLGLDLFFVLSGFLITGALLETFERPRFLQRFYVRRVLRIFPLYYLSLLVFLVIFPSIPGLPVDTRYYVQHQWWFWGYLQNWLFIFHNQGNPNWLNHLWSLAVEEQFYIIWPLVFLVLRKPKYLLIFISVVLVLTIGLRTWLWTKHVSGLSYYSLYTFSRIDGICIGCMVALIQKIRMNFLEKYTGVVVLCFAGLNFGFYFFDLLHPAAFPYLALIGYTTFAMIFGLLVHTVAYERSPLLTAVFGTRFLRFFGKVSYSSYIIHWPLYFILRHYFARLLVNHANFERYLFASTVCFVLSFLLGYISYRYFELRFLRLRKHFS
jgi:peptidoglycan/LPS O-acetylase OafA/YrhL